MKSADVRPLRRVKHLKRGSCYEIVGKGELQAGAPVAEGECLVVYRCQDDGRLWIRPLSEFVDGRFEPLAVQSRPDREGGFNAARMYAPEDWTKAQAAHIASVPLNPPTSNGHLYCKECDRWMAPSECDRAVCGLADA